jgi:DNA repair photolyase
MGLNKSKGQMYSWVTHTWSPIIGCPMQCSYCYVKAFRDQPVTPILRNDFPPLGKNRTIFVGHLCDMFAPKVPSEMVRRVFVHCSKYPNTYVFQSKNPVGIATAMYEYRMLHLDVMLGTTIETNRVDVLSAISKAPMPHERATWIRELKQEGFKTFVTVEPILDFDIEPFADLIALADPDWLNIGADSKGHNLPEPTREKVLEFVEALQRRGVQIHHKENLDRLTREGEQP